jgi:hypothetical protein
MARSTRRRLVNILGVVPLFVVVVGLEHPAVALSGDGAQHIGGAAERHPCHS